MGSTTETDSRVDLCAALARDANDGPRTYPVAGVAFPSSSVTRSHCCSGEPALAVVAGPADYRAAMEPFSTGGACVNSVALATIASRLVRHRAVHPSAALKAERDPLRVFHLNQNIPPAAPAS